VVLPPHFVSLSAAVSGGDKSNRVPLREDECANVSYRSTFFSIAKQASFSLQMKFFDDFCFTILLVRRTVVGLSNGTSRSFRFQIAFKRGKEEM